MNIAAPLRASGDPKSAACKPLTQAVALGQVFTPSKLAEKMLESLGVTEAPPNSTLLDPCVGPATFPSALSRLGIKGVSIHAYDVDIKMMDLSRKWASDNTSMINFYLEDYLLSKPVREYDYAVLNPPYIRQEWIERKTEYREIFKKEFNIEVPGASNMYIYFIVKALNELKIGGRLACIVYDSWQSTRFGKWLQEYLHVSCDFVSVESVPGLPFEGRLIDATILVAQKGKLKKQDGKISILSSRESFTSDIPGLQSVNDLFFTKRGLRLKQADFFMSKLSLLDQEGASPFVKKIGLIPGYMVPPDHPETALIFNDTRGNHQTLSTLNARLSEALLKPESNVSVLTWREERPEVWAKHGSAPWAPLIFNYFLRRRPKHVFNPERIYSDNFYGATPRDKRVPILAWLAALNSSVSVLGILEGARNQGAGLAKLQLFEYRAAKVLDLNSWQASDIEKMELHGKKLVYNNDFSVIKDIDFLVASVISHPSIQPSKIYELLDSADVRARKPRE